MKIIIIISDTIVIIIVINSLNKIVLWIKKK